MLLAANRQELDVTLLAEPSSDEDEELMAKRKRRKTATTRGTDSKADIQLLSTAAVTSGDQGADSSSQFIPPAKTKKRIKSLFHFYTLGFLLIYNFLLYLSAIYLLLSPTGCCLKND